MNKTDALDRLKDLRECFRNYETIEVKKGDLVALSMVIDILKENAQEVSIQEQPDNLYPTKITLVEGVGNNGTYCIDGNIYNSSNAITINILIDNTKYAKKDVYKSIKKVCDKLLQYYK